MAARKTTASASVARRTNPRADADGARRGLEVEEFAAHGRRYRWTEGENTVPARGQQGRTQRRADLAAVFTRRVVPQMERRGARGLIFRAAPAPGMRADDLRWIAWREAGTAEPVWGLYLASRQRERDDSTAPANDAFVLVAWGDGPALAWADDQPGSRAALRAALRVPPPWLARGMRSGDPSFPVRIDRIAGPHRGVVGAPCIGVVRTAAPPESAPPRAAGDALLEIVRAWQREHGREPFAPK